jgi:fatty acid/phospholipid biosynthesis enzyme
MNLAVDAMGGDQAPEMVVQGAVDGVMAQTFA